MLKDGKVVPLDLDADGQPGLIAPENLEEMFQGRIGEMPRRPFGIPGGFRQMRPEPVDPAQALRELEVQRDRQVKKLEELNKQLRELESQQ